MFSKVLFIYKNEGLLSLVKRSLAHVFHNILSYEAYYVVRLHVQYAQAKQERQPDFTDEITGKWIESNEQADEIAKEFEDFRPYANNACRILDAGGIAACIYVGSEFAGFSWLATTQKAMKAISHVPVYVDFKNAEFFSGFDYTAPNYRRRGLRFYKLRYRYSILEKMGKGIEYGIIRTNNYAALRANSDVTERICCARARVFKLLGMRFWKQTPMNISVRELVDKMNSTS